MKLTPKTCYQALNDGGFGSRQAIIVLPAYLNVMRSPEARAVDCAEVFNKLAGTRALRFGVLGRRSTPLHNQQDLYNRIDR